MEKAVIKAALGGILFPLGNFLKSTNILEDLATYVPLTVRQICSDLFPQITDEAVHSYRDCELIALGVRPDKSTNLFYRPEIGLDSVLSSITLTHSREEEWKHRVEPLAIDTDVTYPLPKDKWESEHCIDGLPNLIRKFIKEMESWKQAMGEGWDRQQPEVYMTTLLAVLRKFFWCIPAPVISDHADNRTDVSLYEFLRLTSAIAACRSNNPVPITENKPIVTIVRGDFSGLQGFIYRITRPEADTEHVSKRLRGRSFYLSILNLVTADWLLQELGLPPNCALFIGGGRFDLLVPSGAWEKIEALRGPLEDWLLKTFQGELGIQFSSSTIRANDIADMRRVYESLDSDLEIDKQRKWVSKLNSTDFLQPEGQPWHACPVCRLSDVPGNEVCDLCKNHEQIGAHLPYATHLAFCYGKTSSIPSDQIIGFEDSPFKVSVVILCGESEAQDILNVCRNSVLYCLNQTKDFIHPGIASGFLFLANLAPKAMRTLSFRKDIGTVKMGDVLHFEALSQISRGSKRLGVLKADVDLLSLLIKEGLNDDRPYGLRPTIARLATLSSQLDLFFAGHISRICKEFFANWQHGSADEKASSIDNLFYVVYSGGDDLFIVGPWDVTLRLALQLHREFKRFSGYNSDLSISAGYIQVKPRFPTQKFADMVSTAEQDAKNANNGERNHVNAFDQILDWEGSSHSLSELLAFGDELIGEIERGRVPRGLIYDLGDLHRQHMPKGSSYRNPMWTPRLYYTLSRRLSPEVRTQIGRKLIQAMNGPGLLALVSFVSLIIRED